MLDIIYVTVGLGFFAVCAGMVRLCANLMRPRN